jgi:hypothetical protein
VKAAVYTASDGWGAATYVSSPPPTGGGDVTRPHVACSPNGTALATWQKASTSGEHPWAAVFDGTQWLSDVQLDAGDEASSPSAALDSDGRGFVAFGRPGGSAQAVRWDGTSFSSPEDVRGGLSGAALSPRAAAGPSGEGLVAFIRTGGGPAAVSASTFELGPASPTPVISKLSASSWAPGNTLTITGKNFGAVQGVVSIDGLPASIVKWTKKKIVVVLPQGSGDAVVEVRAADGVAGSGNATFAAPVLSSAKAAKPKGGLSVVTLKGKTFGSIAHGEASVVTVNGTEYGTGDAAVTAWTDKQIKLMLALPSGANTFRVTTSAGATADVTVTVP